ARFLLQSARTPKTVCPGRFLQLRLHGSDRNEFGLLGPHGPLQGAIRLMKHKLICLLVLLTGLALLGSPATAQDISTKGGISGTVVDATGAIVPGATVTITAPIPVPAVPSTAHGQSHASTP